MVRYLSSKWLIILWISLRVLTWLMVSTSIEGLDLYSLPQALSTVAHPSVLFNCDIILVVIMGNDDTTYCLILRALYARWGKAVNMAWREARGEYKRNNPNRICALCNKRIRRNYDYSVDHIIPQNILEETELVGLLFDHRNLRAAHKLCNVQRGVLTIDDMPDNIKSKLFVYLKTNMPT